MGSPKEDAERLEKATEAARAVLSEVHGVTKDLHTAMRKAKTLFAKLVEEEMRKEVQTAVDKLGEATNQAMKDSTTKVFAEFDRLMDLLMGRTNRDRAKGRQDLEAMIGKTITVEEK